MFRWPFRKKNPVALSANHDRASERGVALVLTLLVLALLLVLGISFTYQTRSSLQEAQVNADTTRARLLAESALERAMAFIHYNYDYNASQPTPEKDVYPATRTDGKYIFGYCNNGDWAGRYYAASTAPTPDQAGIETALAANVGFDFTPSWTDQVSHPLALTNGSATWYPGWHHAWGPEPFTDQNENGKYDPGEPYIDLNNDGNWNDNGALVGRMAFLAVDESGKLDPTYCVSFHEPFSDANRDGTYTSGEKFWDWDGNNNYTSTPFQEGSEKRWGVYPQEIDLEYALPSTIRAARDGWRTMIPIVNGTPTRWFSWFHIFRRTGVTPTVAKQLTQTLFPFSYDIEAYYTGSLPTTAANQYHRFDIVNADWENTRSNKPTVSSLDAATGAPFWDTTATPPKIKAPPANGGAIPWLSKMVAADGTTKVGNQVAANIIDYCDSDNDATRPSSFNLPTDSAPFPNPPAYFGNEKSPYINEVQTDVNFSVTAGTPGPPPTSGTASLQITVTFEVVNIFAENLNNFRLTAYVEFSGIPAGATLSGAGIQVSSSGTHRIVRYGPYPISAGLNTYQTRAATSTFTWAASPIPPPTISFNEENISVVLSRVSNGCDLTILRKTDASSPGHAWVSPVPLAATTVGTQASDSIEATDPRCNTELSTWNWKSSTWTTGVLGQGTPGSVNTHGNPKNPGGLTYSYDTETTTDVSQNLSTAFIRNGPPKSLWELGCISRGEPWRTINLKKYGSTGKYEDGDAAILDQVKLGDPPVTHGKVNANSPVSGVWQALLDHIYVGTKYDFSAAGTAISLTAPLTAIRAQQPFVHRGEVAKVTAFSDGTFVTTPQDTDAKQEEIIGKIANLLTVRQNFFTIIATGQAVKDVGVFASPGTNPPDSLEFDSTKHRYCTVLATQKIMAVVYRDAFTNQFKVVRWEYLEE